jgi:uncharacterized protein YgiM (DUF1202 family)
MAARTMRKKEQSIYHSVRKLTENIRKDAQDEISREYETAQRQGKYPWEGMWLTSGDIRKVQAILRKRDRTVFMEVMILFVFLTFLASVFLQIIYIIIPQPGEVIISPYLDIASQSDSDSSVPTDTGTAAHVNQLMSKRADPDRTTSVDKHISQKESDQSEEPARGRVAINILRLRKGPGIDYPIIARLKYGTSITVQDAAGDWIKIVTDTFMVGWVFREYIELDTSSLKREYSYKKGIESQPAVTFTEADKDQTIRMETEPHEVRMSAARMTDHAEVTDAPSDIIAEERNHDKLSQDAEVGDREYVIQVGAWKHSAYAQNVFTRLKRYYSGVRKVKADNLIKILIPDIETKKQGYMIQKEIERKFNLRPMLIRTNRKDVSTKQVTEEPDAALPDAEKTSPALNSNSADNAGDKTAGESSDETMRTADVGSNMIPGIALIVKSDTTENSDSSP